MKQYDTIILATNNNISVIKKINVFFRETINTKQEKTNFLRMTVTIFVFVVILVVLSRLIRRTLERVCPGKKRYAIGGTYNRNIATLRDEIGMLAIWFFFVTVRTLLNGLKGHFEGMTCSCYVDKK